MIFFEMLYDMLKNSIRILRINTLIECILECISLKDLMGARTKELSHRFANQIYTSYDFVGNLENLSEIKSSKKLKKTMNAYLKIYLKQV